ncbi:MAG: hypothetical protein KAW52_05200 [candidate division Zixibacteria bacterium]|nr:hypothetical protein [candidate division Zixibacteria bacterium]
MPKETSRIKALIWFVILESVIFGVSGAVALVMTDIQIPKATIFLGFVVFYHLAVAGVGLRDWKKRIRKPISKGEI